MSILKDLSVDDQRRVLNACASLFGLEGGTSWAGGGVPSMQGGSGVQPWTPAAAKPTSLVEFLRQASPTTNAERLAAFAYFREHHEQKPHFGRADLREYFSRAKEPPPGNYDRDFAKAVKAGWIHESGAESYLTQTGSTAVEAGFSGSPRPRGAGLRRRGNSPSTAAEESMKRRAPGYGPEFLNPEATGRR